MVVEHYALRTPPNEARIWRYMDVGRFLALLRSKSLYFAALRQFEDSWEGVHPEFVRERMKRTESIFSKWIKGTPDSTPVATDGLSGIANAEVAKRDLSLITTWNMFIDHTAICCWHANPEESIAMWKLYTSGDEGVAISSTVEKLRDALEDDVHAVAIASNLVCEPWRGSPPER